MMLRETGDHSAEIISYHDFFYEAEVDQTQTSVKLMPTTNLISQVSRTLVLEAYLLHLLDREKIYTASEAAQST